MELDIWHTVNQGEWLSKITSDYKLRDWKVIWDHPNNAELKKKRLDPNILYPGDQLFIPKPRLKEETCSTDKLHRFKVKLFRDFYELTLLYADGTPIKNQKYSLHITDPPLTGTTDEQGHLRHENLDPAKLHSGQLDIPGAFLQIWVDVGSLNPHHSDKDDVTSSYDGGLSGIQMRLANLGYDPGSTEGKYDENGELPIETQQAIARYQIWEMELPIDKVTGKLDDDTRNAIISQHKQH